MKKHYFTSTDFYGTKKLNGPNISRHVPASYTKNKVTYNFIYESEIDSYEDFYIKVQLENKPEINDMIIFYYTNEMGVKIMEDDEHFIITKYDELNDLYTYTPLIDLFQL